MSDIVFFGPSPSVGLWCDHEARDGGLDAGKPRPTLKGDDPPPKRAAAMDNTKESYAGAFPRRIQLGPNRVCWVEEEVEAWCHE